MACTPLPTPPAPPALPAGISLTPTLPTPLIPPPPEQCCKLLDLPAISPPVPFPVGVYNPAVAEALAAIMSSVEAFLDSRPFRCPKE